MTKPPVEQATNDHDEPDSPTGIESGSGYVDAGQTESPFATAELPHGHAYFQHLSSKLRWRLLFAYVTPLVILSAYFLFQYNNTIRQGVDTHLESIAENQRNTVDLYLQERIANLRGILASIEEFEPPPAAAMRLALEQLQSDSEAFVDVGLFDPDGTLVSYTGPYTDLQGMDYGDEAWFQRVLAAQDKTFISDVYLGFRDKPHFIIAVSRDVAGLPWTLRASVDPEEFSEFVGSSHLIAEADAFIVNSEGRPETSSSGPDREQVVSAALLGQTDTSVDEMEVDGTAYLAAVAPLRKSDWWLVVRIEKARACAPLRRAKLVIGAMMLAALLVVVAVALRSTQNLVSRLEVVDSARNDLQRQLFSAAKLASVGEMAAGVAHEINNPLAVIYEESGIMLDALNPEYSLEPDTDEFRERLSVIADATIRGRDITRKLLAFSRKDQPKQIFLDVNRLVRHALSLKTTEFSVTNIEVRTELAADLPAVFADRNQMEQVLLNLFNNARDAITNNGRIWVRTRLTDQSVQILVEDNGCGMTQELMERVFFPFFTTKEVGKGTGLGLSISYGIVKAMGGNIEVQSDVGIGTTFVITLPIARPPSRAHGQRYSGGKDGKRS